MKVLYHSWDIWSIYLKDDILVKKDTNDDGLNEINHIDARRQMRNADKVLSEVA